MRQRITANKSDHVIALYAEGLSTREVAKRTGVSRTTVLRVLSDANVMLRPRGGNHHWLVSMRFLVVLIVIVVMLVVPLGEQELGG